MSEHLYVNRKEESTKKKEKDRDLESDSKYSTQHIFVLQLVIQALDSASGEISRRTLNVELIDVDDNEPSFLKSNYLACPDDVSVLSVNPIHTK